MDMAAMELAKLKTHNHDLTMQLASAQEQLDILTQSQEGMPAAAPLGDGMVLHSSALSAEQAAGDGAQGIATSLREEMRMRQHCEQRLAEAQEQSTRAARALPGAAASIFCVVQTSRLAPDFSIAGQRSRAVISVSGPLTMMP